MRSRIVFVLVLFILIFSNNSLVFAGIQPGKENLSTSWTKSGVPKIPAGTTGADLVALGQSFKGFDYDWGGAKLSKTNGQGVDCAGFCCRMVAGISEDDKAPKLNTGAFQKIGTTVGSTGGGGAYTLVAYNSKGIPKKDMVVGWILVADGHAVIYAGNGKTIESMSEKYNVCEGTIKDNNTKYKWAFTVAGITYDGSAPSASSGTTNNDSTNESNTTNGEAIVDNGNGTVTTQTGTIALKGAYSEGMLCSVNALGEGCLVPASEESLTVGQTYTLRNWNNIISNSAEETVLVRLMRQITSFVGIMFTVWMIFLYLAYWFDRTNVFFEFSMMNIVSFGRLRLTDNEESCTWQFSELLKGKTVNQMTVNHKTMLRIVIIGCCFGGAITSGVVFKFIRVFITLIWESLKSVM